MNVIKTFTGVGMLLLASLAIHVKGQSPTVATNTPPPTDSLNSSTVVLSPSYSYPVQLPFRRVLKKDMTGAISVLNPESYINQDYNFLPQGGINGRVAGLLGVNNIWGMENALVMIDGVPRSFADITLNEIEQITVLKGVQAVALYGSHAAKGAILITTKRGGEHDRKISVRANRGLAAPRALPRYLGSVEYMTLYNEARTNDGLTPLYDEETITNFTNGNPYAFPNVDYYSSEYLKPYQSTTDANAEFSGGTDQARFYSNLGWSNNSSLLKLGEGDNEGDNRFNVRGNVDIKLNSFITSTIDVSAVIQNSRRGLGNYWNRAATLLPNRYSPLVPINRMDSATRVLANNSNNLIDGQYVLGGTQEYAQTPFADLYVGGYTRNIQRVFQVTNGIHADLENVLKGLSFQTRFNIDYFNSYDQSVNNTYSVYVPTWNSTADTIIGLQRFGNDSRSGTQNIGNSTQRRNVGFSFQFDYQKSLNDLHSISATLLGAGTSTTRSAILQPTTNSNLGLHVGYQYKNTYWVDFSGALVNSTKLAEGNRTAFSPTLSVGWLLSSENFLANSQVVDHLKLSTSAGILNTDLDINGYYLYDQPYTSQAFFSWNDDLYRNQATTSLYGANPGLSFAKRKEVNIGLEASFLKRLFWLEATLFMTKMDDLPTQRFSQYPNYYRTFIPYSNYNSDRRTGLDVLLNMTRRVGEVDVTLGVNATYVKSEVIKRDELYRNAYQNRVGKPVDAMFGLVSNGFFSDEADIASYPTQVFGQVKPGDIKYVDQNGDRIIDEKDEVMIGRWMAPLNWAVNFSATYKSLTLFVQGTSSIGGNTVNTNDYYWVDGDNKYSEVVRNRWTEETKNTATYPRLSAQQNNNNFRNSDFWLMKTDRFNLSKVQLTYNLPQQLLGKSFLKGLSVYVNGSNLVTFAKNRRIMDLSVASAPQLRYFNLGIRTNF